MASLGLLGALGGLGQGLSQTGQMMYNEATEKSREQRLQAIRDKDYARARKDAVSDMDRKFKEGKDLIAIEQNFKDDQRIGSQDFTREMAGLSFKQKKEFEQYVRENFAQSKFGQQFEDLEKARTKFGKDSEQFTRMNEALKAQLQQVIPTKDILGNTTYGILTYNADGSVSVQQIDFESPTGLSPGVRSGAGGAGGAGAGGRTRGGNDFSSIPDEKFRQDVERFRNAPPGPDGNYYIGGQKIPETQYSEMLKAYEEELRKREAAAGQARFVPGRGQFGRAS
jgi:hypothetical protein